MNDTTIPLSAVVAALFPPEHVTTVEGYQGYLREVFSEQKSSGPPAKRGRPIAVTHPILTHDELQQVVMDVQESAKEDPDSWKSSRGRMLRRLHDQQPNDATLVRFDNDVYAKLTFGEWMPYELGTENNPTA
jgi:hypothetical protein